MIFNKKILAVFLFIAFLVVPFNASADFVWAGKTPQLSLVDGNAFIYDSSITLTAFAGTGYEVWITDGSNKTIKGYISTAMGSTTYGSDLVTNGGCELDANYVDYYSPTANARSAVQKHGGSYSRLFTSDTLNDGIRNDQSFTITEGKLYIYDFWTYPPSTKLGTKVYDYVIGTPNFFTENITGLTGSAWNSITRYFIASESSVNGQVIFWDHDGSTGTWYVDDISIKEVTAISGGVQIVSAKGGSTRNWASIESGFNYNDSAYTIRIIPYNIIGSPF